MSHKTTQEMKSKTHVLVIPLPLQGHLSPVMQFSKILASKGVEITLLTLSSITESLQKKGGSVNFESIPDLSTEETNSEFDDAAIDGFIKGFQARVLENLAGVVEKLNSSGHQVDVLLYDAVMPWGLDLARRHGLKAAVFSTQSCTVFALYYYVYKGHVKVGGGSGEAKTISLPSLPVMEMEETPTLFSDPASYPSLTRLVIRQFDDLEKADWILLNTFDKLEEEVVKWMATQLPIKAIGPTIPSTYLDKKLADDKDYGLSLFKSNDGACTEWLDKQKPGSVIYVAFGSIASLGEKQMEELAWGLARSNSNFLWVVRDPELSKLPKNFLAETSEKGLIVNWCPQLSVLAHEAVGYFLTHCGWNSTLEALGLGVPMVAMPQWVDQPTNAKLVVDVWKAGVRVRADENGVVSREEIEDCLKEVTREERRNELKKNALMVRNMAIEAMDFGGRGSSSNNIQDFVDQLVTI